MTTFRKYAETAARIIGKRTPARIAYDDEVLRWRQITGGDTREGILKANLKFPSQALSTDESEMEGFNAYFEYLAVHAEIVRNLKIKLAHQKR